MIFAPEGLLIIAQRFIAGYVRKAIMSPVGTTEKWVRHSFPNLSLLFGRPYGTKRFSITVTQQ